MSRNKKILTKIKINNFNVAVLIFAVIFLVYGNSLKGEILMIDDYYAISTNEAVKDLSLAIKGLRADVLTNSFIYQIFGLNKYAFHAKSLFMHGVASFLLYLISKRLFKERTALAAALLFTLHPVNSEAVSWLASSVYITTALFSLLVIYFYILSKDKTKLKYLSLFIYLLYIVSTRTPWVGAVPVILFILDRFVIKRKSTFVYLYFVVAAIFALYIFTGYVGPRYDQIGQSEIGSEKVNIIVKKGLVVERSVFALAAPLNLSIYPNTFGGTLGEFLSMLGACALVFFIFYKSYKKNKMIFGLLLCMYGALTPALIPLDLSIDHADRYFYLPSAFFCMVLAYYIFENKIREKEKYLIFFVILTIFATRTFIRTFDWLNDKSLWLSTTATVNNPKAFNNLGTIYLGEENYEKALENYEEALKIRPVYPLALYNSGLTYYHMGEYEKSLNYLYTAYKINPNMQEVVNLISLINVEKEAKQE